MKTIDMYCDLAIKRQGLKNDTALANEIGIGRAAISQWRTKRTVPSDETMIKLAELAKEDPELALLHLAMWRTEGEAHLVWQRILKGISAAGLAFMMALPSNSSAGTLPGYEDTSNCMQGNTIHLMRHYGRTLKESSKTNQLKLHLVTNIEPTALY
ncbi:helix-turn-helix domain-containing protein [Magnetococcus sp. PR-3]|uniref:helix-turn-helix domain-containing protein n=1 Tax=Magnetococcus sp. PR-3 TaxID=3120355 RepID=UPI002FCE028C